MDRDTKETVEAALAGARAHMETVASELATEWNHKDASLLERAVYLRAEALLRELDAFDALFAVRSA